MTDTVVAFQFKTFLKVDVRAFCVAVPSLKLSTFEGLEISVLYVSFRSVSRNWCVLGLIFLFLGVGIENVSVDSSEWDIFYIVFTYCMASSWLVSGRWRNGAGLIAFQCFACSGVKIYKQPMWHPHFIVYGCSRKLLMTTVYCLFSVVVNSVQTDDEIIIMF